MRPLKRPDRDAVDIDLVSDNSPPPPQRQPSRVVVELEHVSPAPVVAVRPAVRDDFVLVATLIGPAVHNAPLGSHALKSGAGRNTCWISCRQRNSFRGNWKHSVPVPDVRFHDCLCERPLFTKAFVDLATINIDLAQFALPGSVRPFAAGPLDASSALMLCLCSMPAAAHCVLRTTAMEATLEVHLRLCNAVAFDLHATSDSIVLALSTLAMQLFPRAREPLRFVRDALTSPGHFNPLKLYAAIRRPPGVPANNPDCQHPALRPVLRPYQVRAVQWAMAVEERGYHRELSALAQRWFADMLVPLGVGGLFVNPLLGQLFRADVGADAPRLQLSQPIADVRGGILADEMGLGKTVETIALILCRPASPAALRSELSRVTSALEGRFFDVPIPMPGKSYKKAKMIQGDDDDDDDDEDDGGLGGGRKKAGKKPKKKKARAASKLLFRCVCGSLDSSYVGEVVVCPACETHQHALCAGYPTSPYICSLCWFNSKEKMPSGATIVVTPAAILQQWVDELARHAPTLKVLVYAGVKGAQSTLSKYVERVLKSDDETNFASGKRVIPIVSPSQLSAFDVILVSYNVLRAEITHEEMHERSQRHVRRFPLIPTPLLRVHYQRVVLDEAQMVGGGGATHVAAKMALMLSGEHRWAVSGTPFKRSTRDIQGLLKFLRLTPLDSKKFFEVAFGAPYVASDATQAFQQRVWELLRVIMWRTAKRDASLGLAPTIVTVRVLDFGMAERQQYNMLYARLKDWTRRNPVLLRALKSANIEMHNLRMLCDHFDLGGGAMGGGGGGGGNAGGDGVALLSDKKEKFETVKKVMTLEQLAAAMRDAERAAYVQATRHMIGLRHVLAGLLVLQGEPDTAAKIYALVLQHQANEEDKQCDIGEVLLLHAAHNLVETAAMAAAIGRPLPPVLLGVDRATVPALVARLEASHTARYRAEMTQEFAKLDGIARGVAAFRAAQPEPWWVRTVNALADRDYAAVIEDINANLCARSSRMGALMAGVKSRADFIAVVQGLIDDLNAARESLLDAVNKRLRVVLQREPSEDERMGILRCGECRKQKGVSFRCTMCVFEQEVVAYESKCWFFAENTCPSCMNSVTIGVEFDVEADRANDLLLSREEVEEMKLPELKRRLREQNLSLAGTKATLVQRMLDSQLWSGGAVARGRHCHKCQRWWHARCVAKEVLMRELREPDAPFKCPVCLGVEAARGHEAGRVRYNALPHQILIPLSSAYNRLFEDGKEGANSGDDDDDGDDDDKIIHDAVRNTEMAQQLHRFRAMHTEVGAIRDVHRAVYSYMSSLNELSASKARLRFAEPHEVVKNMMGNDDDDDDEDGEDGDAFVIRPSEVALRRARVEASIADADEERKQALSKYRFVKNGGEQDGSCPICLEDLAPDLAILPCYHAVDEKCFRSWLQKSHVKSHCPICRTPAPEASIKFLKNNQIEVKERVRVAVPAGMPNNAEAPNLLSKQPQLRQAPPPGAEAPLSGSWSTKVTAVVRELKRLFAAPEPCRAIVFSEYNEMLSIVHHACQRNGVSVLYHKSNTAKMVAQFKERASDEKNVVLLLPLRKGAEGLTLIEGNMVFILEPAFPAALEQQAIARIVRVGQTQQTYVYRYIVRGTVEQRLHEIAQDEVDGEANDDAMNLSPDLIQSILVEPSPHFDPVQQHAVHMVNANADEVGDADEDELWWLAAVSRNAIRVTRRAVLETYLKRDIGGDDDADTVVLHGVEVPRAAAAEIEGLPLFE